MPVYEYRCADCGALVELLVSGEDAPLCPNCGSDRLTKLVSAPAAVGVRSSPKGLTCCGRTERCETPPCSTDGICRRE